MSEAFERARAAIIAFWERAGVVEPHFELPKELLDEMLVVADACEEAGLIHDAKWLRDSHRLGYAPPALRSKPFAFIGRDIEVVKALTSGGK